MNLSINLDGADSRFSLVVRLRVHAALTRSEVTAPHAEIQATTLAVVMEIRNRPSVHEEFGFLSRRSELSLAACFCESTAGA